MSGNRTISERNLLLLRPVIIIAILNIAIMVATGQKPYGTNKLVPVDRSRNQPGLEDSNEVINLNTDLVSVAVTVTDRGGRAIAGLPRESFRIFDDNVEQPISFFSEEDTPASVGIVFDTSGSMDEAAMQRAREALSGFIETSHPHDEFSVIGFGSSPQLLLDRVRDGKAVLDKFTYVNTTGNTALYDAVYMGVENVSHGAYPKHAIVLISDGEENNSRCSFSKLRRTLEESGVVVYTVRVGKPPLPKSTGGLVMDQIAAITGGKAFWPKNSESMDQAFEQIALELRRQYSIGYIPTNFAADGKLHKIKVALAVPREVSRDMVVRNREGYYAVAKPTAR
jgi:Ca-activated chloride channel family protein